MINYLSLVHSEFSHFFGKQLMCHSPFVAANRNTSVSMDFIFFANDFKPTTDKD